MTLPSSDPPAAQPRVWRFSFPDMVPGVNRQYQAERDKRTKAVTGRLHLTKEAKVARAQLGMIAALSGFCPDASKRYAVSLVFVFPRENADIDGPIKGALDAIFTAKLDHTVYRLEVEKRVVPQCRRTEVEITELSDLPTPAEELVAALAKGEHIIKYSRRKP